MNFNTLLIIVILIPLLNSIILPLYKNKPNIRELITLISATITLIFSIYITNLTILGYVASYKIGYLNSLLYFGLSSDIYNGIFATMVSFLWIIATIYSIGYMRKHHEKNQTRFYSFFSISIASTLGIAFSSNLLTSFLFYEILTIATIPLVAHSVNGDEEKLKKVKIYIYTLIFTSITLFFLGIILTIANTGTSNYTANGIFAKHNISPVLTLIILLLFIFGVAKAGIMPFHKWLPSAMIAPTPVSSLLHAVAVVKSGVFILFKIIVFIFGIDYLNDVISSLFNFNYLILIPSITIILASIIAMMQDNLKARLAYSTISQLSYIVLALLVLTPTSTKAAFIHIIAHAFSKIALFFAAGSIIVLSHKTNISQLGGIGKKMPITMIVFSIGALSLIGFPLTIGFMSKWFLIYGIIESNNYIPLFVILLSTLLNGLYFIPIIIKSFSSTNHHHDDNDNHHPYEKSIFMDSAMIIIGIGIIVLNFYGSYLISLIIN